MKNDRYKVGSVSCYGNSGHAEAGGRWATIWYVSDRLNCHQNVGRFQKETRARAFAERLNNPPTARHAGLATHCRKGHAYDSVNTYIEPGSGNRQCRKCRYDAEVARRQRAKDAA